MAHAGPRLGPMIDALISNDPLGEALHFLRMSGTMYSRCEFTTPWALVLPERPGSLMFHVVTSGRCWIEVGGTQPRLLQQGDLALVPQGEGHRLGSEPGLPGVRLGDIPPRFVSDRYEILRHGGGGAVATLVCGTVRFNHPAASHLVRILPRAIVVDAANAGQADWTQSTLRFMAAEAQELRPGGETVVTRLADILVIQAIRTWIDREPAAQTGWLGALRDPRIGVALTLIHRDPSRAWSVSILADSVAMSRSAFAARFNKLVGEPPMRYLARWRMHVAHSSLQEDGVPLSELAHRLGYHSDAAFNRAFKRYAGVAPGAVRRSSGPGSGSGPGLGAGT